MGNKIPFIKVRQKNKEFYLLKLDLETLKKTINFHFRYPYLDKTEYNQNEIMDAQEYVEYLEKQGIYISRNINNDIENGGIQRRLSLSRVKEIRNVVEGEKESVFPGTIILSYNTYEEDPLLKEFQNEEKDYGFIDPDLFGKGSTIVIDGQHRMAGILTSVLHDNVDFEIPVTLFLNNSLSESSLMFRNINGKQQPVNSSFIYDLYSNIPAEDYLIEAKLHKVCKVLNMSEYSPFFNQIKMQGTGRGAISQSFFIEYAKAALEKCYLIDNEAQEYLDMFLEYFRIVQNLYPKNWPVPENTEGYSPEELEMYSKNVLSKSKLAKTNGIGALFILYPYLIELTKNQQRVSLKDGLKYLDIEEVNRDGGTGKGTQNKIAKNTLRKLHKDGYKFRVDRFTNKIVNNKE